MANTLSDRSLKSQDIQFKMLVAMAIIQVCFTIKNEDDQATNHAERAAFCDKILGGDKTAMDALFMGVCANVDMSGEPTDVEISNSLAAIWNSYAVSGG